MHTEDTEVMCDSEESHNRIQTIEEMLKYSVGVEKYWKCSAQDSFSWNDEENHYNTVINNIIEKELKQFLNKNMALATLGFFTTQTSSYQQCPVTQSGKPIVFLSGTSNILFHILNMCHFDDLASLQEYYFVTLHSLDIDNNSYDQLFTSNMRDLLSLSASKNIDVRSNHYLKEFHAYEAAQNTLGQNYESLFSILQKNIDTWIFNYVIGSIDEGYMFPSQRTKLDN